MHSSRGRICGKIVWPRWPQQMFRELKMGISLEDTFSTNIQPRRCSLLSKWNANLENALKAYVLSMHAPSSPHCVTLSTKNDEVSDLGYVQLRCTETWYEKCSHSGKNGSKHPMLSISMAYNVISCRKNWKKHSKNQNRWFYHVNLAPELRNHQKWPKNFALNCDLLKFFV